MNSKEDNVARAELGKNSLLSDDFTEVREWKGMESALYLENALYRIS